MIRLQDPVRAEAALRETLDKAWSNQLALDYGLLPTGDAGAQMKAAERWLKKQNDSAELLLTLGRLSLRNHLWGRAREYFMGSLKLQNSPEAHAELGRLLKHMGEQEAYQTHVREGFEVIAKRLPALPMPDSQSTTITQMSVN